MTQAELSKFERRDDHLLSTLRRYVTALGGSLRWSPCSTTSGSRSRRVIRLAHESTRHRASPPASRGEGSGGGTVMSPISTSSSAAGMREQLLASRIGPARAARTASGNSSRRTGHAEPRRHGRLASAVRTGDDEEGRLHVPSGLGVPPPSRASASTALRRSPREASPSPLMRAAHTRECASMRPRAARRSARRTGRRG